MTNNLKYIASFIAGVALVGGTAACLPDDSATPPAATSTPSPSSAPAEHILQEDDPNWDCRFDGNQMCGVTIMGVDYVIQFEDGSPMTVDYK